MVAILLFALAVGVGGNPFLALLLVVPMSLSFAYAFGLLTQMIPRSGGDYMLVSRVIHPAIGWMSVFCMTTAGLLSNAFFGLAVVTAGVVPLCVAVGLVADWPGLVLWAQGAGSSKGWLIFFGLLMFAFAGIIQLGGWRRLLRIQNLFFWMVTASLGIVTIVTLFQSKGHFTDKFNSFAESFTNTPDAYGKTIADARKGWNRGRPELLLQRHASDDRRLRNHCDLQLLVDLRGRRAATGLDDQDGQQHGARRSHPTLPRRALHRDLLQDLRRGVPARRQRRLSAARRWRLPARRSST